MNALKSTKTLYRYRYNDFIRIDNKFINKSHISYVDFDKKYIAINLSEGFLALGSGEIKYKYFYFNESNLDVYKFFKK